MAGGASLEAPERGWLVEEVLLSSFRAAAGFRADFLSSQDGIAHSTRARPAAGPRAVGDTGTALEMAEEADLCCLSLAMGLSNF